MNKELQEIKYEFEQIMRNKTENQKGTQNKLAELGKLLFEKKVERESALTKGDKDNYIDAGFEIERLQREHERIQSNMNSSRIGITEKQFESFERRLKEYINKIEKENAKKILGLWRDISKLSQEYNQEYTGANEIYIKASRAAGHNVNAWDRLEESGNISRISVRGELTPETIGGLERM